MDDESVDTRVIKMPKDGNDGKEKGTKGNGSAFLVSDEVKEIKIEHNGEVGIFKYHEVGAFKHHEIIRDCGVYDPTTGQLKLDLAKYLHAYLRNTLVEAPFELTDANLKKLHPAVATRLANAIGGTEIKIVDAGGHSCA